MPTFLGCLIFFILHGNRLALKLGTCWSFHFIQSDKKFINYKIHNLKCNIFKIVEPKCELVLCSCAQRSLEKCVVWRGSWLFITFVEDCSCRAISFPERWTGPLRESHRRWSTLSGKDNSETALTFSTAARMSALGFTELTMRKALSDC